MTTVTHIHPFDFAIFDIRILGIYHSAERAAHGLPMVLTGTSTEDDTVSQIRRKRCRILVVDDEDIFRASLIFKLRYIYDAIVEEAETGTVALEKLTTKNSFDVILMDISMPGQSGIEVCRAMRERGVHARIVLMSGNAENEPKASELNIPFLNKTTGEEGELQRILLDCGGDREK